MKVFNTEAMCTPEKNYMVDISDKVAEIKKLVDAGKYFTINRARQFGKTTTMNALKKVLKDEYYVIALDFQDIDFDVFKTGGDFTQTFAQLILDEHEFSDILIPEKYYNALEKIAGTEPERIKMHELFRVIRRWCMNTDKPIILMIDEVDSAANNQVFLDFLAQLRSLYIKRQGNPKQKTFHSVILAGVTDVRHLKYKIGSTGTDKENSPWNISAEFSVDMLLHKKGIKGMLDEYEADHKTGMNAEIIAELIYDYSGGYPFLVSRICQIIDTKLVPDKFSALSEAWTKRGFSEAIKLLTAEKNSLFESLKSKLTNMPELCRSVRSILMEGTSLSYSALQDSISQMEMYGFIKNDNNKVAISNRIFETILYNLFLSDEEIKSSEMYNEGNLTKNFFIENDKLNMRLVIDHFIKTYTQVFGQLEEKFKKKTDGNSSCCS